MDASQLNVALEGDLKSDEGYSAHAYTDSLGNLTIGYGFNLDDSLAPTACVLAKLDYQALRKGSPITQPEAEFILLYFIAQAIRDAVSLVPGFWSLCDGAQRALSNMSYNMGKHKLSEFSHMIYALNSTPPDYEEAAAQMADSLWAKQVKERATRLIALMKSCG